MQNINGINLYFLKVAIIYIYGYIMKIQKHQYGMKKSILYQYNDRLYFNSINATYTDLVIWQYQSQGNGAQFDSLKFHGTKDFFYFKEGVGITSEQNAINYFENIKYIAGSGGGGAGTVGSNSILRQQGGYGGDGIVIDITGKNEIYGIGGTGSYFTGSNLINSNITVESGFGSDNFYTFKWIRTYR